MDGRSQRTDYGACPYITGRLWRVEEFASRSFDPSEYEAMLASGWRRSGPVFYRDVCPGCGLCTPIRLDSEHFEPSSSQRRLVRINADLEPRLCAATFSEERYALYRRYVRHKHAADDGPESLARASYASFLLGGPLGSSAIVEYRNPEGFLVATGYVDILPGGISSVYFAFEPSESRRSLGTWSVLREMALAMELGKRYYYLGFWVPGAAKMDYKSRFRPFELGIDGRWVPARDREEALGLLRVGELSGEAEERAGRSTLVAERP